MAENNEHPFLRYTGNDIELPEKPKQTEQAESFLNIPLFVSMFEFLTELMQNDPKANNPDSVLIRERGTDDFTDENITRLINRSTEMDWKEHPSYYRALIKQAQKRGLIPKFTE